MADDRTLGEMKKELMETVPPTTNFEYLKSGDKVTRMLAGMSMSMVVVGIDTVNNLIECAAINTKLFGDELVKGGWQFDRKTGWEEDHELGWGVKFGRTGSYLIHKQ